jgi:RNA polymerase sigma-70 factor, ECF subfamily
MAASLAMGMELAWPSWAHEERVAPDPRRTESELVSAVVGGERNAFAGLVEAHHRAAFALCHRMLRDRDQAADAAQEAFVRAYASLGSFDPAQPFAPWLLRIARNHCLDLLRRRMPAERLFELDAAQQEGQRPHELPDEQAIGPAERMEKAELSRTLETAVATLPEKYRTVIELFHQQHLSYQEISKTMDVPLGTVMTWLHRARAQLRQKLASLEEVAS